MGEWLTTAIHDAKPHNALLTLAAAVVRQILVPVEAARRLAAWRSST
jgi:hypothetical protein